MTQRLAAQPRCWLRLGSWEGLHMGNVTSGWWAGLQLRRLRKLIYVPAASSLPKDDQIIGAETAGFSRTWRQTQMPVLSATAWARPR